MIECNTWVRQHTTLLVLHARTSLSLGAAAGALTLAPTLLLCDWAGHIYGLAQHSRSPITLRRHRSCPQVLDGTAAWLGVAPIRLVITRQRQPIRKQMARDMQGSTTRTALAICSDTPVVLWLGDGLTTSRGRDG